MLSFNQTVSNSMLSGAIESMKLDPTPEKRKLVLEEILKATFLCPATVSKAPVMDDNGEPYLPDDCEIQQQMVQDANGRPLLLAFTDQEQMDKWKEQRVVRNIVYSFGMSFMDYADLMLQKLPDGSYGPAQGFVIDPFGANLVVDRDMVANLLVSRMQAEDKLERKLNAARRGNRNAAENSSDSVK